MHLLSSADIAEALDESVIRVRHVLATRPIKPHQLFGHTRAYTDDVIELVRNELATIDGNRQSGALRPEDTAPRRA